MSTATEWEVEAMRLEAEVAQVCGVANATAGRLVSLIADVLATGSWEGADILSPGPLGGVEVRGVGQAGLPAGLHGPALARTTRDPGRLPGR